jgi:3-deoxy-D-manno-octulosonate 8-phosphate phosphatase KdsC-like HAD superfamily phosphatase/CMP-N-acetylneuraminic acid synthetase
LQNQALAISQKEEIEKLSHFDRMIVMTAIALLSIPLRDTEEPPLELREIGGEPLLHRFIQIANEARSIQGVFVCSCEHAILDCAREAGAGTHLIPRVLYDEPGFPDPVGLHFLREYELLNHALPEVLLFLSTRNPYLTGRDLDAGIAQLMRNECESLFSASLVTKNLWTWKDGSANLTAGAFRPEKSATYYEEDNGFYAFRTLGFQGARSRFFGRVIPLDVKSNRHLEIHDVADLERIADSWTEKKRTASRAVETLETKAVVLDFENILVGESITLHQDGTQAIAYNRTDFSAVRRLLETGVHVILVASLEDPFAKAWAERAGIRHVIDGTHRLLNLKKWCVDNDISIRTVVYIARTEDEAECVHESGLGICVQNADGRIKQICRYTLSAHAGAGAIAEYVSDIYLSDES